MAVTPPEGLMNLSFGDLKTELETVIKAAETAIGFVDRFGWFIPAQYKTSLDELLKLLVWADKLLSTLPV